MNRDNNKDVLKTTKLVSKIYCTTSPTECDSLLAYDYVRTTRLFVTLI